MVQLYLKYLLLKKIKYDYVMKKKVVGPLNEILLKEINELIHEVY